MEANRSGVRPSIPQLTVGGIAAAELARTYGTPLLVLDYDALDREIDRFASACRPLGIDIAYAGKALLLVGLANHLKHTPLSLDVCSLGELVTAERAGFPAERMTMHGCGKTPAELEAVRERRVGRDVVDNLDELHQLAAVRTEQPIEILLRVNTAIEAHTHDFVHTSGQASKFGFDDDALLHALDLLADAAHLRFRGLHSHIGSQIYEPDAFVANAYALVERLALCASRGFAGDTIVAGGGFGIPMHPTRAPGETLDIPVLARGISAAARTAAAQANVPAPGIGIEPGRAIVGACGTSLYRVMSVKTQFGRPYAIIDGGMYENPRPALYDAYHHTVCVRESDDLVETTVCGRTCENDRLVDALLPRDLRAGDLLAMFATGAYTYSMASNYNRFERPAVAAVGGMEHAPVALRESTPDLLRNDIDV